MSTPTESDAAPRRGSFAPSLAIFLLALLPLLVPPVLPTVDYYDHIARYYVLAHIDLDPFLAQNYAPRWAILPNIGMDVLGAALARIVPVLLLAKLLAGIVFTVQYFGLLYLNRKLTGRDSLLVALLGVPLLYSFIFTWGFANFLLGLGLSLWGAGWWVAHRRRPRFAIPTTAVIALVVFLTHGFAFGLFGLLLGGLEIGFFLTSKPRSIVTFAKRIASLAVLAIAPALLFRASATVKAKEGVTNADEAVKRLAESGGLWDRIGDLIVHRVTTVVRVSEGPALWFDVMTNALLLGLTVFLASRRRGGFSMVAVPAIVIGVLLFLIVPPALFGVGYVGDRIPLFVALVAVAALNVRPDDGPLARRGVAVVAGIVAVKLAATAISWAPYRADYADYAQVRSAIPADSVVVTSNFANSNRLDPNPRCEMYGPLLVPAGHAAPLFVIPTAQPLVIVGPLRHAMAARSATPRGHASLNRALDRFNDISAAGAYDYLLACGARRLGLTASSERQLVAQAGRFTLFRLTAGGHQRP